METEEPGRCVRYDEPQEVDPGKLDVLRKRPQARQAWRS